MTPINVAVIGLGYWGPNLARNVAVLSDARLHTLCDAQAARLKRFGRQYPDAKLQTDVQAVLTDTEVDAVVIATPAASHFGLASAALRAGKHILVEKPLARTSAECRELIALAEAQGLIVMTGHVFLFNAAVQKVKEYIQSGELGDIYYIYTQRLNMGRVQSDVNALWNFAPHDFSILCYWLDAMPERIMARGYAYVQPGIEDVVFVTLDFPGGVGTNVHISWLDPRKVRCMTVVGSRKMVVYDDMSADAKIVVYDKGVTRQSPTPMSLGSYENFGEFQLLVRAGDVLIPKINFVEPLQLECQHFVECIRQGRRPLSDGYNGLQVVEILEAAERAMRGEG
ncbi:MAG: Gfo/Idh/MocA family protein [Candidatus Tectimicrobiota bacterium]